METAYDPASSKHLTVAQYYDANGPKLDKHGELRIRPAMVCYACKGGMHTIAETAGNLRYALWGHDPDPKRWCPIKEDGGAKYSLLTPTTPDIDAGKLLRETVLSSWKIHWGYIREIALMADIDTWIGFLHHADKTKFWEHAGLQETFIPYIFLATCDFPPPTNAKAALKRNYWLRFRFTSVVRTFDDLWIRTTGDWEFLKLQYRKPPSGDPRPKHLFKIGPIVPDLTYMSRAYPTPNAFQLRRMKEDFGH